MRKYRKDIHNIVPLSYSVRPLLALFTKFRHNVYFNLAFSNGGNKKNVIRNKILNNTEIKH